MNAVEINAIGALLQSIRHPDERFVTVSLTVHAPGFDTFEGSISATVAADGDTATVKPSRSTVPSTWPARSCVVRQPRRRKQQPKQGTSRNERRGNNELHRIGGLRGISECSAGPRLSPEIGRPHDKISGAEALDTPSTFYRGSK